MYNYPPSRERNPNQPPPSRQRQTQYAPNNPYDFVPRKLSQFQEIDQSRAQSRNMIKRPDPLLIPPQPRFHQDYTPRSAYRETSFSPAPGHLSADRAYQMQQESIFYEFSPHRSNKSLKQTFVPDQMFPNYYPHPPVERQRMILPSIVQSPGNNVHTVYGTPKRFNALHDKIAQRNQMLYQIFDDSNQIDDRMQMEKALELERIKAARLQMELNIANSHERRLIRKVETPKMKDRKSNNSMPQQMMMGIFNRLFQEKKNNKQNDSDSETDEEIEVVYAHNHRQNHPQKPNTKKKKKTLTEHDMDSPNRTKRINSDSKSKGAKSDSKANEKEAAKLDKKANARRNLRICMWAWIYWPLKTSSVKREILEKKKGINAEINSKLNPALDLLRINMAEHLEKPLMEMFQSVNSFVFVGSKLAVPKLNQMLDDLKKFLKAILDKAIHMTSKLPKDFYDVIRNLSGEGALIPDELLSTFELKKFEFTYYGVVKQMDANKSKIILAGLILFPIFLHEFIMNPSKKLKLHKKYCNSEKLINIGSILYHIIFDEIKGLAVSQKNNQENLDNGLRVKPRKPLKTFDAHELEDLGVKKCANPAEEIIEGFYPKSALDHIFKTRRDFVTEVRSLVTGWLDKIFEMANPVIKHKNN